MPIAFNGLAEGLKKTLHQIRNTGPRHGGGLRVLGWSAGAAACLIAAAAIAAVLPDPLLRHMPGEGAGWQYAAVQLGDYLEAPLASPEEARRLTIESVVYSGRPGAYLATILDEDSHRSAEIECLALNIYFEARGESDDGKRAVAHVVMNRIADAAFPSSACAVIREGGTLDPRKCQFTWWCDERSNQPLNLAAWRKSRAIAAEVYDATVDDLTGGALWYHADYVAPAWGARFAPGPQIGRHMFYHKAGTRAAKASAQATAAETQRAPSGVEVIRPKPPASESAISAPARAPLPSGPPRRHRIVTPTGPSEAALTLPANGG